MTKKPHAIMISVPYQGHINPFVSLALKLASKGISVTFVHLEYVHHKLCKAQDVDFFAEARQSGLDIRYTTIGDGFPVEFDREVHFKEYWETMMRDFEGIVIEFVGKIIGSHPDTDATPILVTDTIYPWPMSVAHKYKLVNVSFWTEPALVYSLHYHWDLLAQNGHFPCKDNAKEDINYIPGIGSINTRDLSTIFKESEFSSVTQKCMHLAFERVKKADFILHNTVHELEFDTLSALNKYQPNYAIGPINFSKSNPVNMSLWSESNCARWLESKSPASVLYVSFGSFVNTNKQIIEEIACGLLLSEVNFIWVIRQGLLVDNNNNNDDDDDVFPVGFIDKIKENGLIIPWCDQTVVLSNPAIGGFLTHNGWNSTVESMWFGVPMICYPVAFDQLTNRKLVVDDWKIGVNLCDGETINREEVAKKIKSVMNEGCSKSLREEASKLRTILHNALEIDEGSSERNFNQFFEDLEAKIHYNCEQIKNN